MRFRKSPGNELRKARAANRVVAQWDKMYCDIRNEVRALCHYMNFEPTWQQIDVLKIVERETQLPPSQRLKRIAVKSGQGPGKTALSVILMLWRALQGKNAKGIVTAPTMVQAKDVWLGRARQMIQASHPLIRRFIIPTKSRIFCGGDTVTHPDWGIELMAASRPENTQGRHDEYLTILEEEASGIEDPIDEQIKGTLTNENSLLIKIGNPNFRDVHFFHAFNKDRAEYNTYTMNAEESPMVDQGNVEKIAREYGKDSDVYRVRVLGEFPLENPNAVLSSDDLEACARLRPEVQAMIGPGFKQFGIDLARFGGDENVVYQRQGFAIIDHYIARNVEPIEPIRHALHMEKTTGWKKEDQVFWVIDAGGIGQGTLHVPIEEGKNVREFHSAGTKYVQDDQFADMISEAYFHTKEVVKARKLAIPNDPVLIQQLCTRLYSLNSKGQIKVESKKEYLARMGLPEGGGNSPDRADAFVMCNYKQNVADGRVGRVRKSKKSVGVRRRR